MEPEKPKHKGEQDENKIYKEIGSRYRQHRGRD